MKMNDLIGEMELASKMEKMRKVLEDNLEKMITDAEQQSVHRNME